MKKGLSVALMQRAKRSIDTSIGLVICLIVIAAYNLIFLNKFFPFSEGWFSVIADSMLHGAMPYRDFHFFLPPLYPLILAGFICLFGPEFILLRIFGISIILSMTTILFLLFSRLFPVYIACLITMVSIMYYQSNVAHITYDFLHFLTTFALLSTFLIVKYFEKAGDNSLVKSNGSELLFLFFAGVFASFAFLIKQSNGLFVPAFALLAITACSYSKKDTRYILKNIVIYSAGIVVPMFAVLYWLFSKGALFAFIDQVFKGAAQSKGSIGAILFAWIPRLLTLDSIIVFIVILLVVKAMLYKSFLIDKRDDFEKKEYSFPIEKTLLLFWCIFVLAILSIYLPFWNIDLSLQIRDNFLLNWFYHRALIISASMVTFTLFIVYLYKIIKEKKGQYFTIFIISTASMSLIYGTGTSGGVGDAGLILSLGLMFGHLLLVRSYFNIGKIVFLVLCVSLMFFLASKKYTQPYYWWSLTQSDIRTATEPVSTKYLSGFLLSKDTAKIYSEVNRIVEKYTQPGDTIYTFPNIPVFYLLTNRRPDTFALINWFDVLPDKLAIEEANHILESPPKIIIWLDVPEFVWEAHEKMFRGGQLSGQRKIAMAVKELTSTGDKYTLESSFDVPDGCSLKVWRMHKS